MTAGQKPPLCVIPAAGASSRMGDFKPLLPWGDSTMVEAVASAAMRASCEVCVVTGNKADELRRGIRLEGLRFKENPRWESGMLSSVLEGASLLEGRPGLLVIPADMPLVRTESFALVLRCVEEALGYGPDRTDARAGERPAGPGDGEISFFAACNGEPGHPVWIPSSLLHKAARLEPGSKLRPFLRRYAWRCVETGDPGVLHDLDDREAYDKAVALLAGAGKP